jgi:transcriptional regulator with XRE-family HTH domain
MTKNTHPASTVTSDSIFGSRLRYSREAAKLTQETLADSMQSRGFDFSQATIYKIENGKRKVSIGEALALAEIVASDITALTATGDQDLVVLAQDMRSHARNFFLTIETADAVAIDLGNQSMYLRIAIEDFEKTFGPDKTFDFGGRLTTPRAFYERLFHVSQAHSQSGFLQDSGASDDRALGEYLGFPKREGQ